MSIINFENLKEHFPLGMWVTTLKGCRMRGTFTGKVVGYSKWKQYPAVKIRKSSDGRIVLCLARNLRRAN